MSNIRIFSAADAIVASDGGLVSMLTDDEKALCYAVASNYSGRGQIVEFGPWLGSSTYQICSGLSETGLDWTVTTIDRFVWLKSYAVKYPHADIAPDTSFRPAFDRNLAEFGDRVHAVEGDLAEIADLLPITSPIEMLFVDAPKTWRMMWTILNHVGPHLTTRAQIVVQNFFHMTMRQLVWLFASIPQLRVTNIVENGQAAALIADGPIPDLAAVAPPTIEELTADQLMTLWQRLAEDFPVRRLASLAVGMAIDLIDRGAFDDATTVLASAVADQPFTAEILAEIDRLIRQGDPRAATTLRRIAIHLRTGLALADLTRDRGAPGAAQSTADPLAALDRADLVATLAAVAAPRSAAALAIAYQVASGHRDATRTRALLPAFDVAVDAGVIDWATALDLDVRGRDIVEIGDGPNLHGLVLRAMGARHHVLVDAAMSVDQKTIRGEQPGQRLRLRDTVRTIADTDGAMEFVADADTLDEASADLVIVRNADEAAFRAALHGARRVLRPAGRIRVDWANPLAWRAHGLAPQQPADFDPDSDDHKSRADWRHAPRAARRTMSLAAVEEALVDAGFVEVRATRHLDDMDILARLTPRVRRAMPDIAPADLATVRLQVDALAPAAADTAPPRPRAARNRRVATTAA